MFKIVSEESISSGVRRIEALTGLEAIKYMNKFQDIVLNLDDVLQIDTNSLIDKVKTMNDEYKNFKKQLENIRKSKVASMTFTEENNNIMFAYTLLKDVNPKDVKGAFIDFQNKKYNNKAVLLCITKFEGKLTIILGISRDLNEELKANELIKSLVEIAGGNGGGGQPWFAMGGAVDKENPENIKKIIDTVRDKIESANF